MWCAHDTGGGGGDNRLSHYHLKCIIRRKNTMMYSIIQNNYILTLDMVQNYTTCMQNHLICHNKGILSYSACSIISSRWFGANNDFFNWATSCGV